MLARSSRAFARAAWARNVAGNGPLLHMTPRSQDSIRPLLWVVNACITVAMPGSSAACETAVLNILVKIGRSSTTVLLPLSVNSVGRIWLCCGPRVA